MRMCKLLEYIPIRQFTWVQKENAGIKTAFICERAMVRAKYNNLTKREESIFHSYIEDPGKWNLHSNNVCIVNREKLFKLATIYYREVDETRIIIDIHYHLNRGENGYRSPEQVKADADRMIDEAGCYEKQLVMGEFLRYKRRIMRRTKGVKHIKKVYTKIG